MDVFDDVYDSHDTSLTLFNEVIDRHLPRGEKRVKKAKQPDWITTKSLRILPKGITSKLYMMKNDIE